MSTFKHIGLLHLITLSLVTYLQAQRPQLVFHFVANTTSKTKYPETRDVHLQPHLDYLLFGLMCKSPGNRFVVRVSPSSGTTEVVDEISSLHNSTESVRNCQFPGINPVKCESENFCNLGNRCNATVLAVCQRQGTTSRWMMTQVVDVTLDQVDGSLVVVRCLTKCLSLHIRKEDKKKQKSDSSLTKTLKSITRWLILSVKKVFVLSCLFCFCYQPFSGFP